MDTLRARFFAILVATLLVLSAAPLHATCGDGTLDPGEGCDDANVTACDGCSAVCQPEPAGASWCLAGGPEGGPVIAYAVDPSNPDTAYAGTRGGILRTTDGGLTWLRRDAGVNGTFVRGLAVSPGDPAVLVAAVEQSTNVRPAGVYWTADAGGTWTHASGGGDRAVAFDPFDPTVVYSCSYGGVARSTDFGRTWTPVSIHDCCALAVDPTNPGVVYAGGSSVHKTTDGGTTWNPANGGLANTPIAWCSLAVDPAQPSRVYVTDSGALFRSDDAGATWSLAFASPAGAQTVALDPQAPSTVYVGELGVTKSTDGGDTWSPTSLDWPWVFRLAVDASGRVHAATGAGVFTSADGGNSWAAANAGLHAASVMALAPGPDGTILAATDWIGVWSGTNDGGPWLPRNGDLPIGVNAAATTAVADPAASGTLYAGVLNQGVFKTIDGGTTWQHADTGLAVTSSPFSSNITLAIDPQTPTTLYAALWKAGVFKTTDGGASWTALDVVGPDSLTPPVALAIDPAAPDTVYVGLWGAPASSIRKSTDGGATWVSAELSNPNPLAPRQVSQIVVDPNTPTTVYASASPEGIYKSVDGGLTWQLASNGIVGGRYITSIVIDPGDSRVLYATDPLQGIYVSVDAGESWLLQPDAALTNILIRSLAAFPVPSPSVLATGLAAGVAPAPRGFVWAGGDGTGGPSGVFRKASIPCTGVAECDDADSCTADECDATTEVCLHHLVGGCTTTTTSTTTTTLPSPRAPIGARKLKLKAKPSDPGALAFAVSSKDAVIAIGGLDGGADDPLVAGGTLRIVALGGDRFDRTYELPPSGWTRLGRPGVTKGYRYRDRAALAGPVGNVGLGVGRLKAAGKGAALAFSLASDPTPVRVILSIGGRSFCMRFGGTSTFVADRSYSAKDAPRPSSCPP
ncbi:MAG TPA: hypothetical protein VKA21_08410 [Candidatus Binatia bacterium]|nr:hypothetical protein [Candidatus Binatia bacterium]